MIEDSQVAGRSGGLLAEWRGPLRLALKTYLPLRLMLIALGIAVGLVRPRAVAHGLGGWLDQLLLEPWSQYDVRWYVDIARDGYAIQDGRAAFHPLLPLLMGLLGRVLGGQYVLAGLIVNDIACVGMLATFYRLVDLDHGPAAAREATGWLLHVPIGFVFLLPYTESLTLCFILLAFWFARREGWLAAGLCGCLAVLAKQPAIAVAPALFLDDVLRRARAGKARGRWRTLASWATVKVAACLALIPLGYLGVSIYRLLLVRRVTAGGAAGLSSLAVSDDLTAVWGSRFGWPWEVLARIARFTVGLGADGLHTDWVYWVELALGLAALAALGFALRRLVKSRAGSWVAELTYSLFQLGLISTIMLGTEPLLSIPRRFLLIFPIIAQLGIWSAAAGSRSRLWRVASMTLMLLLAAAFAIRQFIP